jgi:hypothetical protein
MGQSPTRALLAMMGLLAPLLAGVPLPVWSRIPAVPSRELLLAQAEQVSVERYRIKVSEGTAWTNLRPESWLIFDVSGQTVVARHATFVLNAITSLGKWWDHPATELRACRVAAAPSGDQLSTCVRGERPTPDAPLQVILPAGTTIYDVLFRVRWQERGQEQEATLRLPADARPTVLQRP